MPRTVDEDRTFPPAEGADGPRRGDPNGKAMVKARNKRHTTQTESRQRRRNNKVTHSARQLAAEAAMFTRSVPHLDADPVECLQEVLDGYLRELRYCQEMVNAVTDEDFWRDTIAGKTPHEWVRLRDFYAAKLENCSTQMVRHGLIDKAIDANTDHRLVPSDEKAAEIAAAMKEAGL